MAQTSLFLERLFEYSIDGVLETLADGAILRANPAACRALGYGAAELCQLRRQDVVVEDASLLALMSRRNEAGSIAGEAVLRRSDGSTFPVTFSSAMIPSEDGLPHSYVIFRDISESKRAESALRESETKYRLLVEQSPEGIFLCDAQGALLEVNRAGERMLGYSAEELRGKHVIDLVPADEKSRVGPEIARLAEGGIVRSRWTARRKDGSTFEGELTASQLPDGRLQAVAHDVTERKQAETALRESEQRYRELVEASVNVVWSMDERGFFSFATQNIHDVLGWSPDELLGHHFSEFVAEEQRELASSRFATAMEGKPIMDLELNIRRPDGADAVIYLSARPMRGAHGEIRGAIGTAQDVTAQRAAEKQARENEEKLKVALGLIDMAVFTQDSALRYTWMYRPQLGYQSEEVVGRTDAELLPAEAAAKTTALKRRALETGLPQQGEVSVVLQDGEVHEYALVIEPQRDPTNRLVGIIGASLDVTHRKWTEQQLAEGTERLRSAEAQFRSLIENALDLILVVDDQGVIQFASPSVMRLLGYAPDSVIGEPGLEFIHPDDRAAAATALRHVRSQPALPSQATLRARHANGSWRTFEIVGKQMEHDPDSVVLNGRDVTDRQRLEEQFRQAQKMEALGRLTGGVAHDFNNMLAVILSYSSMTIEKLATNDPRRGDLLEIKAAAERAAGLTRQLLAFSRRQVLRPTLVDLNTVVSGMKGMLSRMIGEDVQLVVHPAAEPVVANVDNAQLEQVILNLAVNARDAMPEGGTLTIDIERIAVDASDVSGLEPGGYAVLTVADTGCGMDAATRMHVFEPFFTTKEMGKGTGLGLSTVFGIVEQSGGQISVKSEVGRGSSFRILLPMTEVPTVAAAEPRNERALARASGTVLLVEDEEIVRRLAATILESGGLRVITAQSADEAMAALERHGPVDLLLTDVVMPNASGLQLAGRVRSRFGAGLPVVYMTGYPSRSEGNDAIPPDAGLVLKPFSPESLLAKVHEAMRRRAVPAAPRVLAIDDRWTMLDVIRRALDGFEVVALADAREALGRLSAGERFDAILCDLHMPYVSGAQFLERLQDIDPGAAKRVLFLTGGPTSDEDDAFLQAHRDSVLTKPIPSAELRARVAALIGTPKR